jgi:hypothetical protein
MQFAAKFEEKPLRIGIGLLTPAFCSRSSEFAAEMIRLQTYAALSLLATMAAAYHAGPVVPGDGAPLGLQVHDSNKQLPLGPHVVIIDKRIMIRQYVFMRICLIIYFS